MTNAARLAIGTLTRLPVGAPDLVDRRTSGRAMALAPLVGIGLGTAAAAALFAGRWWVGNSPPSWLPAVLAIAALAAMTGGLHLDGLADTADGLASGRRAGAAVTVMTSSEVGALGAASLVLVLLLQVSALTAGVAQGVGTESLLLAVVTGRVLMTLACSKGVPAARSDGLGASAAGTVGRWTALGWVVVLMALAGFLGWADEESNTAQAMYSVAGGLAVGLFFLRRCVRRFGGISGDVLGGTCEVGATAVLILMAGAPHAVELARIWPP